MVLEMSRVLQKTPRQCSMSVKMHPIYHTTSLIAPLNANPPNSYHQSSEARIYFLNPGFLAAAFSLFSLSLHSPSSPSSPCPPPPSSPPSPSSLSQHDPCNCYIPDLGGRDSPGCSASPCSKFGGSCSRGSLLGCGLCGSRPYSSLDSGELWKLPF